MSHPHEQQTKEPPLPSSYAHTILNPSPGFDDQVFRRFHHHTLSDLTTGSSESSPTTTISTVDDSSATEPSPGSSPESPPPTTFTAGMLRPRTSDDSRPYFELQKQQPPKKGRNLKNLAVNTSRNTGRATSSTPSLPLAATDGIAPVASPTFVKPPTPQKRKPSNLGLTLLTPGTSKAPPQEIKLAIPPTPAVGRPQTLRHFQSSPSLPLVPQISIPPQQSPAGDDEQNFDVPLSKEEKPEAYPEGPICVYEPYIDLYLEPTAEQCRRYDVVMNVASEVRNPLVEQPVAKAEEPEIRIDGGGGIQFAPRRDRLNGQQEEASPRATDNSPTTPKATAPDDAARPNTISTASDAREPDYMHIKWEHNSDIVPDLLRLVKLLDEMVLAQKRVLVHCQCGVSRSASLVVAYGLYKNPSLSVQEAYDIVKRRSKWIGPNMNLIMQLQEFRTSLQRGGLLSADRGLSPITPSSAISEWGGPFSMRSPNGDASMSAGVGPLSPSQTAESLPISCPGPSSAPSAFAWPLNNSAPPPPGQRARAISAVKPGSAYVNTSGRVVPVVPLLKVVEPEVPNQNDSAPTETPDLGHDSDSTTPTEHTTSPRTEEFAMTPLQPSPDVDPADSFGLMSPSSTEFASSPFDRSALLAQLGMGSMNPADSPRRAASMKTRPRPAEQANKSHLTQPNRPPRLRGKISSPSIREQQQLQSWRAELEASLPHRTAQPPSVECIDEALMSPRATEFTQNPFAISLAVPPAPTPEERPGATDADPRSPAQKGVSPITRSILDVL
ncbi:tyrosine/serine/threonine protein phosphatase [Saxophila tyrrhenica]|uniref:protein-tyrosine-phosphatase n=1 Tax=Saxophila tyrrhenica TaxID=1690608 RepID=A0AAV9PNV9_9PEZI|nr:tyrosine/serine/threonine protein phosphatase [Saxophila tyrrhenica]